MHTSPFRGQSVLWNEGELTGNPERYTPLFRGAAVVVGATRRSGGEASLQRVCLWMFSACSTLAVRFCTGREFREVTTGSKGQWLAEAA